MARDPDALGPREQRFVEALMLDPNQTKAAIAAGYSERSAKQQGSRLMQKPAVREAIRRLRAERAEMLWLDSLWVLKGAQELYERSMQAVPVLDKKGNPTGEYRFDSFGAAKALDLVAKHNGMLERTKAPSGPSTPEDEKAPAVLVVPPDSDDWKELGDARTSQGADGG